MSVNLTKAVIKPTTPKASVLEAHPNAQYMTVEGQPVIVDLSTSVVLGSGGNATAAWADAARKVQAKPNEVKPTVPVPAPAPARPIQRVQTTPTITTSARQGVPSYFDQSWRRLGAWGRPKRSTH